MKENDLKRHILSGIITIVSIAVLTIIAELNEGIKNLLKNTFYHHWIGKGVVAIVLFIIFAHIIKINTKKDINSLINQLIILTILSGLAIIIFFTWHTFK